MECEGFNNFCTSFSSIFHYLDIWFLCVLRRVYFWMFCSYFIHVSYLTDIVLVIFYAWIKKSRINFQYLCCVLFHMHPSHHTVAWRRGGGRGRDWDGHAQSFDHGQDVFRHVGGVVAVVLPAAQLWRQNVSCLCGGRPEAGEKMFEKKNLSFFRRSECITKMFVAMATQRIKNISRWWFWNRFYLGW